MAAATAEADAAAAQIPTKIIKFGTNVDLSSEKLFAAQLREVIKATRATIYLATLVDQQDARILSTTLHVQFALLSWQVLIFSVSVPTD